MTLQTPRVVFDLRNHISFFQAVVQNLGLIIPITADIRGERVNKLLSSCVYLCELNNELHDKDHKHNCLEVSYVHQGCIYLIKNFKTVIL